MLRFRKEYFLKYTKILSTDPDGLSGVEIVYFSSLYVADEAVL
jgi:hypothetical protein